MALRPSATLLALPLLGALLSAGCDDPDESLRALELGELPERFACDDVTVVAATADGSEALLIGVEDGLAAAAIASGVRVEAAYELPDERLTVRWVSGSNVYEGHCGRGGPGEWRLDERWDAIAGTLAVRITPEPDGRLSVSAELDGLLLTPMEPDAPLYELSATSFEQLELDP